MVLRLDLENFGMQNKMKQSDRDREILSLKWAQLGLGKLFFGDVLCIQGFILLHCTPVDMTEYEVDANIVCHINSFFHFSCHPQAKGPHQKVLSSHT